MIKLEYHNILENIYDSTNSVGFKAEIIKLFTSYTLGRPSQSIGRTKPSEIVINLHSKTENFKLVNQIKKILLDILKEYHNTNQNILLFNVIKSFEIVTNIRYPLLVKRILNQKSLASKQYSELNLEVLLVNNLKNYELSDSLKNLLAQKVVNCKNIEMINYYLDLFIVTENSRGENNCFQAIFKISSGLNNILFATQYLGSKKHYHGEDVFKKLMELRKVTSDNKIFNIFEEIYLASWDGPDWYDAEYWRAINCICRGYLNTLIVDNYYHFLASSKKNKSLIVEVRNTLLLQGFVDIVKSCEVAFERIPDILTTTSHSSN